MQMPDSNLNVIERLQEFMKDQNIKVLITLIVFLMLFISGTIFSYAESQNRRNGWGTASAYHKHYDVNKFEAFKARVVKVKEVVPMAGMSPAVALEVKKNGHIIEVQICPTWFVQPEEIGIKPGDRVKIRGVSATINGKPVFMASKIKKGDYFELKVRLTKDGRPFWTMTPEEIFGENRQENGDDW
jgi:hypothetical protein